VNFHRRLNSIKIM